MQLLCTHVFMAWPAQQGAALGCPQPTEGPRCPLLCPSAPELLRALSPSPASSQPALSSCTPSSLLGLSSRGGGKQVLFQSPGIPRLPFKMVKDDWADLQGHQLVLLAPSMEPIWSHEFVWAEFSEVNPAPILTHCCQLFSSYLFINYTGLRNPVA